MAKPAPPRRRSNGCLYIILGVIALLVVFDLASDALEVPREYTPPKSPRAKIEAFATRQLEAIQARSFARNVEHCGMIYEDEQGKLSASEIFRGESAKCGLVFEWGGSLNPVASFHTHAGYGKDFDNETPSVTDIESDIKNMVDGYIATPGGRLWRVDWQGKRTEMLCGEGCLAQDPKYRPCPSYAPARSYTIEAIRQRNAKDSDNTLC